MSILFLALVVFVSGQTSTTTSTTPVPSDVATTAAGSSSTDAPSESSTTTPSPMTTEITSTAMPTNSTSSSSEEDMLRWIPLDAGFTGESPGLRKRPGIAVDGTSVYVFGGEADGEVKADMWLFDLESRTWSTLSVEGETTPSARFDAMVGIYQGVFYVSGGEGFDASGNREFYGDLWAFDLSTNMWTEVDKDASVRPAPRYGHAGGVVGNKFITSHGFAASRLKDTLSWDLDSGSNWEVVIADNVDPIPRCLMGVTTTDSHLFMYGGCGSPGGPCPMSDLWAFDVSSGTWEQLADGPYALNDADLAATEGEEIVLVGGTGGTGQKGNEVHTYSAGEWVSAEAMSDTLSESDPIYNQRMVGVVSEDASIPSVVSFGGTNSGGMIWGLFGTPNEEQVMVQVPSNSSEVDTSTSTTTTPSPGSAATTNLFTGVLLFSLLAVIQ